jgi:Predicted transcriptional regulators
MSDLIPSQYNPRKITAEALDGLSFSIEKFGYLQPIVWNRRSGRIVGGHQRYEILNREGVVETDVVPVDLDDEYEKALNITLNNEKIQGEWDADKFNEIFLISISQKYPI